MQRLDQIKEELELLAALTQDLAARLECLGAAPYEALMVPTGPGAWEELLLHLFGPLLTQREREICARRVLGQTDAQIAADLYLARTTIGTYLGRITGKFYLHDQRQIPHFVFTRLIERTRTPSRQVQSKNDVRRSEHDHGDALNGLH